MNRFILFSILLFFSCFLISCQDAPTTSIINSVNIKAFDANTRKEIPNCPVEISIGSITLSTKYTDDMGRVYFTFEKSSDRATIVVTCNGYEPSTRAVDLANERGPFEFAVKPKITVPTQTSTGPNNRGPDTPKPPENSGTEISEPV